MYVQYLQDVFSPIDNSLQNVNDNKACSNERQSASYLRYPVDCEMAFVDLKLNPEAGYYQKYKSQEKTAKLKEVERVVILVMDECMVSALCAY